MSRFTHRALAVLRGILVPDELPAPPAAHPPPAGAAPGASPLRRLLAPDPFPPDLPPLPRRHGRWLTWLFAAEPLDP